MNGPALILSVEDQSRPVLIRDAITVMAAAFDPAYGEAWTADQLRTMLDLPGTCLIAGHLSARMVGFSLIRTVAGESELLLLAVSPWERRRGHGRHILEHSMTVASRLGAQSMFLEVREGNEAVALYESAMFVHYNSRKDYYLGGDGRRRSALSFRRELSTDAN